MIQYLHQLKYLCLCVIVFQGGIVLLLMGVCLTVVQKSVGRKLSVELGGELASWLCVVKVIAVVSL